jgi:hypothetical protein
MARFFLSLSSRAGVLGLGTAGVLSLAVFGATALRAQPSMVPSPEQAPPPSSVKSPAPAPVASAPAGAPKVNPTAPTPTVTTNAAAKVVPPVVVPPVPDTFNRYGKIWAPSDDVAHPLKLTGRFPGVAEITIPSQDELNDRDKLEQLTMLSDAEIRAQLEKWPPYGKMKLGDQGQMLSRIQGFKEQRTRIAMDKAHALGILDSLTPDQKVRFEKDYWGKRRQMDREEVKQIEPILKAWEQKLDEGIFRDFSSVTLGPVAQAPKPPPPGPPPTNQPPQAPAPVTQIKAAASALAPAPPQPMAQAPR